MASHVTPRVKMWPPAAEPTLDPGGWGESVHGSVWTTGLKTLSLGLSPRWRQRVSNHGQGWEGPSISNDRSGGRGRNGSPSHTSSLGQLRGGQEVCEQSPGQSSGATLSFSCLSGRLLSRHKEGKKDRQKERHTSLHPQLSHFILRKIRYHLPIRRLPPGFHLVAQVVKSLP